MRSVLAGAVVLAGFSWAVAALGQGGADDCRAGIGVSRVVEVDTSSGPRFGQMQYRGHDFLKEKEVVLTFDDGPLRAHTKSVLEALSAHCTKATFFMVGRMAIADPEMVREVARRGHTIGTHTWSHAHLNALAGERAQAQIEVGMSAVEKALGKPVAPFFRFPYLADTKALLAHLESRGIASFSIDIDSFDYRTPNAETVYGNVMNALSAKGKGIILFHDIQPSTARGLKRLLDDLKARGFRIVHVVPKSDAMTVVEYNATAAKELTRSSSVSPGDPFARRSLVWPIFQSGGAPSKRGGDESWMDRVFRR
jgi:peptidoglycan/xylan/chitin deacetylase (PgdA/CDA1 family)